jgi:hypothetical protein
MRSRSQVLEVGYRNSALRAGRGDQEGGSNQLWEPLAPQDRRSGMVSSVEPDAAHAQMTGITGSNVRGSSGDEFAEVSRPSAQRFCHPTEVVHTVKHMPIEPEAGTIAATESML